jgi:hypothetical protein
VAAVGRRETAVEADRGGPDAGQADAPGRIKKSSEVSATATAREYVADGVSRLGTTCCAVLLERTVYRYVGHPHDDHAVRQHLKEIAATRVR